MDSYLTINEEDDFAFNESSASSGVSMSFQSDSESDGGSKGTSPVAVNRLGAPDRTSAGPTIDTPVTTGGNTPKKRKPFDIADSASDTTGSKKR
ncbi:hypothetical protein DL769_003218 [Monosporascus sp. CRB-8-3]|nr:hypothetical protein DL769_003218 [Monosporascus sp. CRB-8-3]